DVVTIGREPDFPLVHTVDNGRSGTVACFRPSLEINHLQRLPGAGTLRKQTILWSEREQQFAIAAEREAGVLPYFRDYHDGSALHILKIDSHAFLLIRSCIPVSSVCQPWC